MFQIWASTFDFCLDQESWHIIKKILHCFFKTYFYVFFLFLLILKSFNITKKHKSEGKINTE